MKSPSWLALPRALHLRVRSFIGAGMRSKRNRSGSPRRSVRIAKSRVQSSHTPEPSLGWHLRRIVAIVIAFCIFGGALNVAPPAFAAEANGVGLMQSLKGFFTKLWDPDASDADKLGTAFIYDESGNLLSETGTGGANSTGSTQYIYLPTADGPMPIAALIDGQMVAVHSDHLNTPRRLTDANGQVIWQWAYSAFGDEQPTVAANRFANVEATPNLGMRAGITEIVFNLRGRGRYYDKESGLDDNHFRTYCPACGRYTQPDPMGLDGGWNRFGHANQNTLKYTDPDGRFAFLLPAAPTIGGWAAGAVGATAGAVLGWNVFGPMLNDGSDPSRGLPPEGIKPPIPEADQCKPGPASRPSERDKGGQSLWDPNGGEWRWFPGDKWHNPHWDNNAHDRPNSPWVNVPHGGLPPVKS
jgi:RHS repeat-associated protein